MAKYLFIYHGGENPETEEAVAAVLDDWGQWPGREKSEGAPAPSRKLPAWNQSELGSICRSAPRRATCPRGATQLKKRKLTDEHDNRSSHS